MTRQEWGRLGAGNEGQDDGRGWRAGYPPQTRAQGKCPTLCYAISCAALTLTPQNGRRTANCHGARGGGGPEEGDAGLQKEMSQLLTNDARMRLDRAEEEGKAAEEERLEAGRKKRAEVKKAKGGLTKAE